MRSFKCINCGLVAFHNDEVCRRCGVGLETPSVERKRAAANSARTGSVMKLFIGGAIIVGAAYFSLGSKMPAQANTDAPPPAAQAVSQNPATQPTPEPLSRSDNDRQRTRTFQNAVKNSDGIKASDKHTQQIDRMIQ